jgi:hypothetical protein
MQFKVIASVLQVLLIAQTMATPISQPADTPILSTFLYDYPGRDSVTALPEQVFPFPVLPRGPFPQPDNCMLPIMVAP